MVFTDWLNLILFYFWTKKGIYRGGYILTAHLSGYSHAKYSLNSKCYPQYMWITFMSIFDD